MEAATPVTRPWQKAQLDSVTKKQIIEFIQENANEAFLTKHRLRGKVANLQKSANKKNLDDAYEELFDTQAFRTAGDDQIAAEALASREASAKARADEEAAAKAEADRLLSAGPAPPERKRFTRTIIKKGDGRVFPAKGDVVKVKYRGMLPDGKVFDSNTKKGQSPLQFKVGEGKVIRGWDEALLEMSVGEKSTLQIEAEWAYGKQGVPGTIPPDTPLTFEVELDGIIY
eukprot:TRINITY_DN8235_c0_g1_i1.p1 TRINITY_DN8235_c0_g1~~TRINITY_DN8235_c0_g1_i1.p1  ORF type:complete len:229 (+),score=63.20 TRINITY_DN8235_c0_g1_i1:203-889(+)